jgi:hypothetical protein
VIARLFHRWERRLASVDNNRVVRPFEWGAEWLAPLGLEIDSAKPQVDDQGMAQRLGGWADAAVASSDTFYSIEPTADYCLEGDRLSFPSAVTTPHRQNNVVRCRFFPCSTPRGKKRAVLVLPQWNSDAEGHVGLCQLLNRFNLTALRLTMPYHEDRRPPELDRADFIVSANVGRTVQANRQAVLDARRAIAWLAQQGYESIGILGTSLGSCLSMLTTAHEPLIRAAALNHVSPFFADVVWEGLSTEHVRAALDGHITLDQLRRIWMPISPHPYLERVRGKSVMLIYARWDLTFPVHLSQFLISEFTRRHVPHQVAILPCGHYTTGVTPFKYLDGITLCRFLNRKL